MVRRKRKLDDITGIEKFAGLGAVPFSMGRPTKKGTKPRKFDERRKALGLL